MGGQQFGTDAVHLDMRGMTRVIDLDAEKGIVDVEAGIEWSELLDGLLAMQRTGPAPVGDPAEADRVATSCRSAAHWPSNIHGRGLTQRPIVDDVESFTLVDPTGEVHDVDRARDRSCSASSSAATACSASSPRSAAARAAADRPARRHAGPVDELMTAFEERIAAGYMFGDCQFSIDERSDDFLRLGILSCYRPDESATAIPDGQRALTPRSGAGSST